MKLYAGCSFYRQIDGTGWSEPVCGAVYSSYISMMICVTELPKVFS